MKSNLSVQLKMPLGRKAGRAFLFAYFFTVCKNYADTLREVSHVYCCFFAS